MNFQDITNKLKQILDEEQLNEMAIKPWKALPTRRNPMDCVRAVRDKNKERSEYLLNSGRKDRQLPQQDPQEEEHRVGCHSKYKLFRYNNTDYYFGILWGEEDKQINGKLLQGNGLAHIMVNHGSNFEEILKNLNYAIFQMSPKQIKTDKWGNLEIVVTVDNLKYVFKNYKELRDNYFYLHTAY